MDTEYILVRERVCMNHFSYMDGFLQVAAITPDVRVADTVYNTEEIIKHIQQESMEGSKICVFPELSITAYTCGDLFFQNTLLESAKRGLLQILEASMGSDMLIFVGLPWQYSGKLYNVCACIQNGKILALIPKTHLPNYNEFYEKRYFTQGMQQTVYIEFAEQKIPMGTNILLSCSTFSNCMIAAEICEDIWVANSPSIWHTMAGANIIVNLSASNEMVGKAKYREELVKNQSAKLSCAYIYANAGDGESTQDLVFSGHNMIAENGNILAKSKRFVNGSIRTEIDLERLEGEKRKRGTPYDDISKYTKVEFYWDSKKIIEKEYLIYRKINPRPFIPEDIISIKERCEEILMIQAMGLKKRLQHIGTKCVVLGISGGLDSTLAILVCAKAFDLLGLSRSGIHAITMPGFGTSDRTYDNACKLTQILGANLEEISIVEAVKQHLQDIRHDIQLQNITYENAQARERTQILMDIANRDHGLVIGTGDLSELALGWATYNGDHMSMYAVNSSIPKTLIRYLVKHYADTSKDKNIQQILLDILDTPVSPELLPLKDGKISQKTEDLVGPYDLHDFFLYYIFRFGFSASKIYRLTEMAFQKEYDKKEIYKWLFTFYHRFFSQQFKRSCLPDGPKVGSISLSPRGDWRMPSDAAVKIWIQELEKMKEEELIQKNGVIQ